MNPKFSAIDVGSNAMRMIVGEILSDEGSKQFRILKKYRSSVRLGHDVFCRGTISDKTMKNACQAFKEFADINKEFQVKKTRAVATSAVREAKNKTRFVQEIQKSSQIKIEVIDGIEEASLIHLAVYKELDLHQKKIMLIDIGGGSVEITFSDDAYIDATKSFPIGTVRLLEQLKKKGWDESHIDLIIADHIGPLSKYIDSEQGSHRLDFAVGTGGNLETLAELKKRVLGKSNKRNLTITDLEQILQTLKRMSIKERINKLELKPDRADVIVPAISVVYSLLRLSETRRLVIPGVGLRDGLLWSTAGYKK